MTLCIAAICHHEGKPRIALCSDMLASTDAAASETTFKLEILSPQGLAALFADDISEAHELLSIYRHAAIPSLPTTAAHDLQEALREPLHRHKRRKIESLVRQRLGLSYDDFLARGDQIEPSIRLDIANAIDELAIEVALLLVGFGVGGQIYPRFQSARNAPFIYMVCAGEVTQERTFACLGAGAEAAELALNWRGQDPVFTVEQTLYHLYEAKKLAELAPSVGKTYVSLAVIEPPLDNKSSPSIRGITRDGYDFLGDCYRRYGPKDIKRWTTPAALQMLSPLGD